ncbi:hypothetical protein A0H76_1803 [Hepatospora eriocheir]|uniref:Uncharacterized protein n=1 Tax=Hepatospora eriocheir TaxID=1081669 RepID=A0A1X0QGJ9_9MICR|nr:hypothetical protein A0H76_1803 [Hepatospora eriocheir]
MSSITTPDIFRTIASEPDIESMIQSLKSSVFPLTHYPFHREKLENIKYFYFKKIKEYLNKFLEYLNNANMCLPENEKILKREAYDLFYMRLMNTHKRAIKLQNIRTIEEAVTIVEGFETNSNLETSNNNSKQIRRFSELQENEDLNISNPKKGKFLKYKYCKYHKWCGHTTEECTKINTNKKGAYSIKETTIVPQRIEVT